MKNLIFQFLLWATLCGLTAFELTWPAKWALVFCAVVCGLLATLGYKFLTQEKAVKLVAQRRRMYWLESIVPATGAVLLAMIDSALLTAAAWALASMISAQAVISIKAGQL